MRFTKKCKTSRLTAHSPYAKLDVYEKASPEGCQKSNFQKISGCPSCKEEEGSKKLPDDSEKLDVCRHVCAHAWHRCNRWHIHQSTDGYGKSPSCGCPSRSQISEIIIFTKNTHIVGFFGEKIQKYSFFDNSKT